MRKKVADILQRVRQDKPLVHHLTNWVTIYDCAQIVKTLGASPVMAHAPEEVADMVQIASALVLNVGTLTNEFMKAARLAAQAANRKGIPIVLDACGAGATPFRDDKIAELLDTARISIIKGNASEVARVGGNAVRTKGVDAGEVESDLVQVAKALARLRKATVVITAKDDIVTDGATTFLVSNGHPLMTRVVGTGCMAASVIGAFAAVEKELPIASACALSVYGIAAEIAAEKALGPAAFKQALFDSLYGLEPEAIEPRVRITRL